MLLTEPMLFSLSTLIGGADDSPPKEVQVLKAGSFEHSKYGKFQITPEDLASCVENFKANVMDDQIPYNYEHGNSLAHGTKAAGWIQALSLKNDGTELWATVNWTAPGAQELANKEWKYSSAEISWKWKHPETGKVHGCVLTGAALTNTPIIKGMNAIAASEFNPDKETETQPMKLNEIQALLLSEHGVNLSDLQARAALADSLKAEKLELSDKLAKATGDVKDLTKENAELAKKAELSEKASAQVKFDALKAKGMADGKLTKAFAEGRLTKIFLSQGFEAAEELVADLPKTVNTDALAGSGGDGGGNVDMSKDPGAELARLSEDMARKEKMDFSEAMTRVRKANPELVKRYDLMGH